MTRSYSPLSIGAAPGSGVRGMRRSVRRTVSLTVNPVNDAPVATPSRHARRGQTLSCRLPASDVDGDSLTYAIVGSRRTARFRARREPHVHAGGELQRLRLLHLQGERRHRRLEHRDGLADRHAGQRRADRGRRRGDRRRGARHRRRPCRRTTPTSTATRSRSRSVGTPAHGTAVIQGGNVRYTPTANYNGGDSFTYAISTATAGPTRPRVAMTVTPVNDAPVATDSSATVAQDVARGRSRSTRPTSTATRSTTRSSARPCARHALRLGRDAHVHPGRRLHRPRLLHLQGERRHG